MEKTKIMPKSRLEAILSSNPSLGIGNMDNVLQIERETPKMSHEDFNLALFRTYMLLHLSIKGENKYLERAISLVKTVNKGFWEEVA